MSPVPVMRFWQICVRASIPSSIPGQANADIAIRIACEPVDHDVTKSLYFDDPDGSTLEVCVDVSDGWRREPSRIATVAPLTL
jgi:hypothetical protein